jgi:hypothetical protein
LITSRFNSVVKDGYSLGQSMNLKVREPQSCQSISLEAPLRALDFFPVIATIPQFYCQRGPFLFPFNFFRRFFSLHLFFILFLWPFFQGAGGSVDLFVLNFQDYNVVVIVAHPFPSLSVLLVLFPHLPAGSTTLDAILPNSTIRPFTFVQSHSQLRSFMLTLLCSQLDPCIDQVNQPSGASLRIFNLRNLFKD